MPSRFQHDLQLEQTITRGRISAQPKFSVSELCPSDLTSRDDETARVSTITVEFLFEGRETEFTILVVNHRLVLLPTDLQKKRKKVDGDDNDGR
jgi:hypothetical protein